MSLQNLVQTIQNPQAIKVFWDTIPAESRLEMVRRLYASRELHDRKLKAHRFDDILARRMNWRILAVQRKPEPWRIERLLAFADANPLIIHDICHAYLKSFYHQFIEDVRTIGDDGQPNPAQNQYPTEWYLRVVDYLQEHAPPPIAGMCMFTLFSDCAGRNEAFVDARYQSLWDQHLAWSAQATTAVLPNTPTPAVPPTPEAPASRTTTSVESVVVPALPAARPTAIARRVIPHPEALPDIPAALGALDRVMMRAINDSTARVQGALSDADMQHALREFLSLNSDVATYHFHMGYYLGLNNQPFKIERQQHRLSQSWSYLGYVLGGWRDAGDDVVEMIGNSKRHWDIMLSNLESQHLQVLYQLVPSMAARDRVGPALVAELVTHCPIPQLKSADHTESIPAAIYAVAANLVRSGDFLAYADTILQTLITQLEEAQQQFNLYGKCLRKRGQLLRRRRSFPQATELFTQAIAVPEFSEIAQTYADIGLASAGFQALDALVPDDNHDFKVVQQALQAHVQHFHAALQIENGDPTNAQFVLGILAFANGDLPTAYGHFAEAKHGMERQLSAYKVRNLYDWAVFLKLRSGLTSMTASDIPGIRDELAIVFPSQTFFPLAHWQKIYHSLARIHAPTGRDIMLHLFQYRNVEIFDLCDVDELLQQSQDIWQRYFFGRKFVQLPRAEKYTYFVNALQLALLNDNEEAAEYVLNLIEQHASDYSEFAAPVDQLITEHYEHVVRIWEESDVLQFRIQLHFMMGLPEQAVSLIEQLLNIYLGKNDFSQARATLAWLREVNSPDVEQYASLLETNATHVKPTPCRVLYVGGNETQQSFKDQIDAKLAAEHPYITITWELIGWRSNWDRDAERIERIIDQFDLVILSPYVRTLFGRHIRRVSQHWRSSTGKGQGRIYHDIVAAVRSFQMEQ